MSLILVYHKRNDHSHILYMNKIYFIIIITLAFFYSCKKDQPEEIIYPETGLFGINILDKTNVSYTPAQSSFTAEVLNGAKLKIVITAQNEGIWYYRLNSINNWTITTFEKESKSQIFKALSNNQKCDLSIRFETGSFKIDYYEMGDSLISYTKTIQVIDNEEANM